MKLGMVVVLLIASLMTTPNAAHAWLGDDQQELTQRYGKPKAVEPTTGDIPMQRGYYAELKENFSTNMSLIATASTNYDSIGYGMDLVEVRDRSIYEKDGLRF